MLNLKAIVHGILKDYALPWDGIHGVSHWARVLENGLRLTELIGAKVEVVQLFAVFHDSCRVNEAIDPDHGKRGADLAAKRRGSLFDLSDDDYQLLYDACAGHTDGGTQADITIETCWDADRLDLGRVGMMPDPNRLCTPAARSPEIVKWAHGRAVFLMVPQFISSQWGIDAERWGEQLR